MDDEIYRLYRTRAGKSTHVADAVTHDGVMYVRLACDLFGRAVGLGAFEDEPGLPRCHICMAAVRRGEAIGRVDKP